jgi:hypothetical protein
LSSSNQELDMTFTPASPEDTVMTPAETARMLGLSEFTLLRKRKESGAGGLPFVRLSQHRIGYIRRDVLAFLAARRVGALPQAA